MTMRMQGGTDTKLLAEVHPTGDSANTRCFKAAKIGLGAFLLGAFVVLTIYNLQLACKVSHLENSIDLINHRLDLLTFRGVVEQEDDFELKKPVADSSSDDVTGSDDVALHRARRSPENRQRRSKNRKKCQKCPSRNQIGCHLVGTGLQEEREEIHFSWVRSSPISTCLMATLPRNGSGYFQSIRISTAGYYYVYAQITFNTPGDQTVGFKTVMFDPWARDYAQKTLMTSVTDQKSSGSTRDASLNARDSLYQGGMFFLKSGQYLEVHDTRETEHGQRMDLRADYSYFGVVYMFGQ